MKTRKLKDTMETLRRVYPKIDPKTRYMYNGKLDRKATSNAVAVHIITWSDDGRVALHKTIFRKPNMTMAEWSKWLHTHAPKVIQNQVRAYLVREHRSIWHIEKIFGWHFDRSA